MCSLLKNNNLIAESRSRRSVTPDDPVPGESAINDDYLDFTLGFSLDGVPDYADLGVCLTFDV